MKMDDIVLKSEDFELISETEVDENLLSENKESNSGYVKKYVQSVHDKSNHQETKIICSICGKSYRKDILKAHMVDVHGPRVKCEHCGKEFKKRSLKKHIEFFHEGIRRHRCKICNKFYSSAGGLRTHISLVHEEQLTCLCPVCGKNLKNKYNLRLHLRIHTGEKPYACENCPLRFSDPSSLTTHMKHKHREKVKGKMMICDICDQAFIKKFLFRKHIHDNHTLKDFSEERLKDFTEEATGKIVELIEKTDIFVVAEKIQLPVGILTSWSSNRICPVCGKNVNCHNMNAHILRHEIENEVEVDSEKNIYQCNFCPSKFKLQQHLMRHISVKHDKDLSDSEVSETVKSDTAKERPHTPKKQKTNRRKVGGVSSSDLIEVDPKINQEILEKIESLQSELIGKRTVTLKEVEEVRNYGLEKEDFEETEADHDKDPPEEDGQGDHDFNSYDEINKEPDLGRHLSIENENDSNFEIEDIKVEDFEIEEEENNDEEEDAGNVDLVDDTFGNTINHEEASYEDSNDDIDDPGKPELSTDEMGETSDKEELETADNFLDLKTKIISEKDEGEDASEDLEIFKTDAGVLKVETDSDYEEKPDRRGKNKANKKGNSKKKVAPKTEIALDLSKYGLDETSREFVIMSDYIDDDELLVGLKTKKYAEKTRLFQCSTCDKRFNTCSGMRKHMLTHSEETNYQCPQCPTKFKLEKYLKRHISLKHNPEAKVLTCSVCGLETTSLSVLKYHRFTHEKSNQCSHCGKMYATSPQLKKHIAFEHGGQSKYKHTCEICGKSFIKTYLYKTHLKVHDGSVVISCETCGHNFASFQGLKLHQKRIHEGIRPERKIYDFPCSECDKIYHERSNLTEHMRIVHEGIKDSFKCSFCQKKFGRKRNLDVHILLHTGEFKRFDCEFCSATYKEKRNLQKHIEKHHTDQLRTEET